MSEYLKDFRSMCNSLEQKNCRKKNFNHKMLPNIPERFHGVYVNWPFPVWPDWSAFVMWSSELRNALSLLKLPNSGNPKFLWRFSCVEPTKNRVKFFKKGSGSTGRFCYKHLPALPEHPNSLTPKLRSLTLFPNPGNPKFLKRFSCVERSGATKTEKKLMISEVGELRS